MVDVWVGVTLVVGVWLGVTEGVRVGVCDGVVDGIGVAVGPTKIVAVFTAHGNAGGEGPSSKQPLLPTREGVQPSGSK